MDGALTMVVEQASNNGWMGLLPHHKHYDGYSSKARAAFLFEMRF